MVGSALWRACARLQCVVRRPKNDAPLGICMLELLRCCPFSVVCRIVYLEQLHWHARTINLTVVLRIPLPLTLPLARAKEDLAATLGVTSAILGLEDKGSRRGPHSGCDFNGFLGCCAWGSSSLARQAFWREGDAAWHNGHYYATH